MTKLITSYISGFRWRPVKSSHKDFRVINLIYDPITVEPVLLASIVLLPLLLFAQHSRHL